MPANTDRKLRVFLCHSSQDKPIVRELYQRLNAEGWIDPWLDEEKLLPGQDWDMEIEKAVDTADAVVVFLSNKAVTKEGYVQKELRKALDVADEKPDGTIFIIPLRLENIEIPRRLRSWQYVDYSISDIKDRAYIRLILSLRTRYEQKNEGHVTNIDKRIITNDSNKKKWIFSKNIFSPLILGLFSASIFLCSLILFFASFPNGLIVAFSMSLGGIALLLSVIALFFGYYQFNTHRNAGTTSGLIIAFISFIFICGSLPLIYVAGDDILKMLGINF